ncbi:copper chaperone PCu(A)C [Novosphingobium sp.]|uniref:copper chaperone PCu(A)C n=1 Tax=Novosphingobium sp. TaxID=1874826 RepID=UPI0033423BA8
MRRTCLMFPFVALTLAAALAGCSAKPDSSATEAATDTAASEIAGPGAAPGLTLAGATVQLPAVPGRPAVAYFTLTAGAEATGKLVAVHVDHFARAEMHESRMEGTAMTMATVDSVPLTPGKAIVFAPGGYHVMLFDADPAIKAGGTTEVTLTLDNGDKISGMAKVTAAGGDDMGAMKM